MKNIFMKIVSAFAITGVAFFLTMCLNPLNFDESKALGVTGKLETVDVTSAVLVLANKSKTTDVTNVSIGGGG